MSAIDSVFANVGATGSVPGAVAGVVRPDGPVYLEAFGLADPAARTAMQTDSVFPIASMTKAVTSVAAMQLVEKGELSLDEPLADLLPGLAAHQVLMGYNDEGKPQWRPPASAISLRQLLSHSSGLGYHIWNPMLGRFAADEALNGSDIYLGLPLAHDPGSIWEYSVSTDWVGQAVEASSGLSLEEYFQAKILGPLEMVDTTFEAARLAERLVPLNQRETGGSWSGSTAEIPDLGEFYSGGGGLVSTASDYLRFVQALLRGGELEGTQIVSPETVALMGENQIGELVVREMPESLPLSNAFLIGPPGEGKFGLGFQINTAPLATGRSAGSLAWAGLFNTYYWIDPTAELAGVICMQMLPFFDGPCIDLFERFEKAVYASV